MAAREALLPKRAQFAYCFLLGPSPLYFISRVSPSPILDVYDPYDYLIKKKINYTAMLFGWNWKITHQLQLFHFNSGIISGVNFFHL
jgi:hypothetical protein